MSAKTQDRIETAAALRRRTEARRLRIARQIQKLNMGDQGTFDDEIVCRLVGKPGRQMSLEMALAEALCGHEAEAEEMVWLTADDFRRLRSLEAKLEAADPSRDNEQRAEWIGYTASDALDLLLSVATGRTFPGEAPEPKEYAYAVAVGRGRLDGFDEDPSLIAHTLLADPKAIVAAVEKAKARRRKVVAA